MYGWIMLCQYMGIKNLSLFDFMEGNQFYFLSRFWLIDVPINVMKKSFCTFFCTFVMMNGLAL